MTTRHPEHIFIRTGRIKIYPERLNRSGCYGKIYEYHEYRCTHCGVVDWRLACPDR